MSRVPLIVLQVLGALCIVAWPGFATVLIYAAPKSDPVTTILYITPLIYPVVWIGLWVYSWRLFRRDAFLPAHAWSAVPVVLTIALFLFVMIVLPTNR